MNGLSTAVHHFRSERKCFSISGSLMLMLLLVVTQVACRATTDNAAAAIVPDEYTDVDNVEIHHVKIDADGVMREDHPIVMYKEDFVSEDYDPTKNRSKSESSASVESVAGESTSRPTRKYKDIAQRRRRLHRTDTEVYNALKPEKVYFDILPQAPVVASDESGANDSKFDVSKIRAELVSLTDISKEVTNENNEETSKQLLSKRPKKFHRRTRRDAERRKRNPYLRHTSDANSFDSLIEYLRLQPTHVYNQQIHHSANTRRPVEGKLWNALHLTVPLMPESVGGRFGDESNTDIVSWGNRVQSNQAPSRPISPQLPSTNLSDIFTIPSQTPTPQNSRPTRRPDSIFRDPRPENADTSFLQPVRRPSAVAPPAPTSRPITPPLRTDTVSANESPVSTCVWAIINCCSTRDADIRYTCFERHGCHGSFWDLNPCADGIRDNVVNSISDLIDQ